MDSEPSQNAPTSPFSASRQDIDADSSRRHKRRKTAGVIVGIVAVVAIAAVAFLYNLLSDPLRTLEKFPAERYLQNHKSLQGAHFRADLKALEQLEWNETSGRLAKFELYPEGTPLVILIPPDVSSQQLTPGQRFEAELTVEQGGLIKAASIRRK